MVSETLDGRSRAVLNILVRSYIGQGKPIGSESILARSRLGLSPATIRNILSKLEEEGYLLQPHTSAGRIPTDKGYRSFVDSVSAEPLVHPADKAFIRGQLAKDFENSAQPLGRVSHFLAELSNHVGLVVAANVVQNELQHIEFVRLSAHRILVVLVTKPGIIQNRLLQVRESFTQGELDQTAQYLMANFPGKSLTAIRTELHQRLRDEKAYCDELLRNAIVLCEQRELAEEDKDTEVFVDGASKMMTQVTFQEVEKLKGFLEALEEKSKLVRLLDECLAAKEVGTRVLIGSENRGSELEQCAVITAPYWANSQRVGSLGVIGPKRMSYDRAMGLVDYVAKMVTEMLSSN